MEEVQNAEAKKSWFKFKATKHDGRLLAFWQFLAATIIILGAILMIVDAFDPFSEAASTDESATAASDEPVEEDNCNVTGLTLHGDVVSYIAPDGYDSDDNLIVDQTASENIAFNIEKAEKDEKIKAIMIEIDSYGGSPVAGEEIANALKNAKKPTVALIRGAGDSAAYWAATGADRIFASKNSDVGSIGVTMSYLDSVKMNKNEGLTYNQLSAGKFKDTGDPDKPLSTEEINLIMRDVNIMHQNFIKDISDNRKLGIEKVTSLADGSTMLGEAALKNGLIDQIGGEYEVKQYLKSVIGAEPQICW